MAVAAPLVLFFGGNGHCAARLDAARRVLDRADPPFEIVEASYPGFEGRPRAANAPEFLSAIAASVATVAGRDDALVYATGIGALFALTLRVKGALGRGRMIFQAPVLWGLAHRFMPRLARAGLAPVIPRLFATAAFQRRFARRQFVVPAAPERLQAFFDGYARCTTTADLFRWCSPEWLRDLETAVAAHPERLADVEVWWGGRDRVIGPSELRWTGQAIPVRWPERTFADWGHYPMWDDPEGWVAAVAAATPRGSSSSRTSVRP